MFLFMIVPIYGFLAVVTCFCEKFVFFFDWVFVGLWKWCKLDWTLSYVN